MEYSQLIKQDNKLILWSIPIVLFISHLSLNTYFPNLIINTIGIGFVIMALIFICRNLKLPFSVVLVFYILNHFGFASGRGGLYCIAFPFVYLFSGRKEYHNGNISLPIIFSFMVLLFFNMLGWILKSQSLLGEKVIGAITLLSYLLMFIYIGKTQLHSYEIGRFIKFSLIMEVWVLLSQLNNRFGWLTVSNPLIGFNELIYGGTTGLYAINGTSPLVGEYSFILFLIGFYLLIKYKNFDNFNLSRVQVALQCGISAVIMLLSANRSTFLLSIIYIFILFILSFRKGIAGPSRLIINMLSMLTLIYLLEPLIRFSYIFERLGEVNFKDISMESINTGEGINRTTAFDIGKYMIRRENWFIGYGWDNYSNNRFAWFGAKDFFRGDPHSLYYALPMLFGWIGSAAFIFFIIYIALLVPRKIYPLNESKLYARQLSYLFSLCIGLLMINNIKQGFICSATQFMFVMIILGITYSLKANSLK
jgi:hypothetical protein